MFAKINQFDIRPDKTDTTGLRRVENKERGDTDMTSQLACVTSRSSVPVRRPSVVHHDESVERALSVDL